MVSRFSPRILAFFGIETAPIAGVDEAARAADELRRTTNTLTRFTIVGFSAIGGIAVAAGLGSPGAHEGWVGWLETLAGGCLLAAAASMLGGLVGFLFGIPRALQGADGNSSLVNTNLEQISDWLTKILVGVSLTQLTELPTKLWNAAELVAPIFAPLEEAEAIAATVIVSFAILGFFAGYLCTRLFLTIALLRADRLAQPARDDLARGEGFVGSVAQADELAAKIEALPETRVLQLVAAPPAANAEVLAMLKADDPAGSYLRDAAMGRRALIRLLVMGDRTKQHLAAWEKALA